MRTPEQKNLSWMKELVRNFSRPEDPIIDFCAGTWSTATECVLLGQYRKFEECNVEAKLLATAEANLVYSFASQVFSPKFIISGSGQMQTAAKIYKDERAAVSDSKKTSV